MAVRRSERSGFPEANLLFGFGNFLLSGGNHHETHTNPPPDPRRHDGRSLFRADVFQLLRAGALAVRGFRPFRPAGSDRRLRARPGRRGGNHRGEGAAQAGVQGHVVHVHRRSAEVSALHSLCLARRAVLSKAQNQARRGHRSGAWHDLRRDRRGADQRIPDFPGLYGALWHGLGGDCADVHRRQPVDHERADDGCVFYRAL